MTVLAPPASRQSVPLVRRLQPLTGAGFVACALAGNSLTESVSGVAAAASSTAARLGLALELSGLLLLIGFVAWLGSVLLRGPAISQAAYAAVLAGGVLIALKLGSGADLLAAWHHHDTLDRSTVAGLVAANDEAFVLSWLPMGVLVAAGSVALARVGMAGPVLRVTGVVAGSLTVAFGVLGSVMPGAAVPLPFLACLVWLVAVGAAALRRQ